MTRHDDAQLLDRFDRRLAAIEAEVPSPPGWRGPAVTRTFEWRFQSMSSATRFVVAGAIVALFGAFLLTGILTQGSLESVPGKATDDASMAVARFEVDGDDSGWPGLVSETDEGLLLEEGSVQFGVIYAPGDPRFEGDLVHTYDSLRIDDETEIRVHAVIIANDGGRWIGTGTAAMGQWMVVLDGVDGYEGLTAVWTIKEGSHERDERMEAVIFPGDMPAAARDWCRLARDDYAAATSRAGDDQIGWVKEVPRRVCPSVAIPE